MAGLQDIWPMVSALMVSKQGLAAHPRRSQRGLDAGMASADHDDVILFWINEHVSQLYDLISRVERRFAGGLLNAVIGIGRRCSQILKMVS